MQICCNRNSISGPEIRENYVRNLIDSIYIVKIDVSHLIMRCLTVYTKKYANCFTKLFFRLYNQFVVDLHDRSVNSSIKHRTYIIPNDR